MRRFSGIDEPAYRALLMHDAQKRLAIDLPETVFEEINAASAAAYEDRLDAMAGVDALPARRLGQKAVAS